MLTSQSLFGGETVTDGLAAVVRKQPNLEALPNATPPAVRLLIERCLRKDPRPVCPRFLVKRPVEKGQASKLERVTNWASLLD